MNEVPEIITQCVSRDEAALAIAQKVFKRLYENTASQIHVVVHLGILEAIRDVCKRVVKELTSWVSVISSNFSSVVDSIISLLFICSLPLLTTTGASALQTSCFSLALLNTCPKHIKL